MACLSGKVRSFSQDPSRLLVRVCELGDKLELNRSELLRLRNEARAPSASPELLALAGEGGILEQRAREGAALVARLRTENAALHWAVDCDRQRARALQKERQRLLQQLGSLEQSEWKMREAAHEADLELTAERRLAEERTYGQETALGVLAARASSAEERWQESEAHASRLRAATAEAESAAATATRTSAADAAERAFEMRELQQALAQATLQGLQSSSESEEQTLLRIREQILSEKAACTELRRAECILAEQVETSQSQGAETEKRALQVARELVDSSQAIAWLQNEVAVQREIWAELDALRSHNDWARQRLQDSCAAVAQMQEPLAGQPVVHAVTEALQLAWEGEAKEHRQAQLRLQNLEVLCLTPVRQQLLQLVTLSEQWKNCLNHWRFVAIGHAATHHSVPEQAVSAGLDNCVKELRQRLSVEAAQGVCNCIESLAQETLLCLFNSSGRGRAGTAAVETSQESQISQISVARMARPELSRAPGSRAHAGQRLEAVANGTGDAEDTSDTPSLTSSSVSLPSREASFLTRSAARKARGRATAALNSVLPQDRGADSIAGTAGPLYRLEGACPCPAVQLPTRRPFASNLSRLSLEFEDRFDDYSVHRPRQDGI